MSITPEDAERELSAVLERELRQLIVADPARVYHYTSIDGLVGICNSGQLYLSDARTSHDLSELQFGAQVVRQTLKNEWPEDPVAQAYVKAVEDGKWWGLGEDLLVYAMCFCEEPDSLTQWRGVAPSSGVALEFDFGMLRGRTEQAEHEPEFGLGKIHYRREEQEGLISRVFKTARSLMSRLDPAGRMSFMLPVGRRLLSLALYFKHEAFSSEKEWRIIAAGSFRIWKSTVEGP